MRERPVTQGFFITGTDTAVGKTVVTTALLRRFRLNGLTVGAMKPVETGVVPGMESISDAARLRAAAEIPEGADEVNPYRFPTPLAPYDAARLAGVSIDPERMLRAFHRLTARYRPLLVEGAGGLLVPILPDWSMRDLLLALDLPVILVGRAMLGGVNHALLTLESLSCAGCRVEALVLTQPSPDNGPDARLQRESTVELLKTQAGVPVFGPVPYRPSLRTQWNETIEELAETTIFRSLADSLSAEK